VTPAQRFHRSGAALAPALLATRKAKPARVDLKINAPAAAAPAAAAPSTCPVNTEVNAIIVTIPTEIVTKAPSPGKVPAKRRHPGAALGDFWIKKPAKPATKRRPVNDPAATIPSVVPRGPKRPLWKGPQNGAAVSLPIAPLPKAPRPVILTPITLRIEALIGRMAASGQPMSSNVIIADVLSGPGRETVRRSIERLLASGRLVVDTKPGFRRATVVATGQTTDWGAFVTTGHAPFSLNPRGSVPAKPKRPDYKPDDVTPFRYRITPMRLVETTPATCCQYIFDGPARVQHRTCDAPSVRGHSWCMEHGMAIYPSWKNKFAKLLEAA
jgi:hypothetical protein